MLLILQSDWLKGLEEEGIQGVIIVYLECGFFLLRNTQQEADMAATVSVVTVPAWTVLALFLGRRAC